MKSTKNKFTPAMDKRVLLFLAGGLWIGVGIMLLSLAFLWLDDFHIHGAFIYAGIGVFSALLIHHFGFLKIVDKNLDRILPMEGKQCVFSFMSWKSYLMVGIMMALGALLRHSPIPKPILAVLYTGIGLALILSSVRYLRVLFFQIFSKKE